MLHFFKARKTNLMALDLKKTTLRTKAFTTK